MTFCNTNINQSVNRYGNVQLQCTEKNERSFHANSLAEAVTETNAAITASLQDREDVTHCLISPASLPNIISRQIVFFT